MKKILRNILFAILLIPICLGFFGCKKDDTPPEEPTPNPPPTLTVALDTLEDIIDLGNLSMTVDGSASANYLKTTNGQATKNKTYNTGNFTLKADGSDFYLNIGGDTEHYLSENVLYSREILGTDTYSKWDITYNNMLHNVLEKDGGLANVGKFIKPIAIGLIENISSFNENWVTTRNLNNGGYGLDINVSLTSMLNKIQKIINETYADTSENKTLEAFIDKVLAEKYPDITLEEILIDLFGNNEGSTGFVKENTKVRTVLTHLDEKFGLDTYSIVSNMLNTYYLLTSSSGTVLSARIATDVIMETTIYSAITTINNFVFDTDETYTDITPEQVRDFVNNIVDKYFRSETYTVEYLCDKINPTINELLGKDIDIYALLTTCDIEKVDFNIKIETNADKTELSLISGDMDIKLGRETTQNQVTTEHKYSLTGSFGLAFSGHGTTTVTPPTVQEGEYKKINLLLVVRDLYENSSYREVLEIPYFTEDIEIESGNQIFRYESTQHKFYISPDAVNYMLGIINYEKIENPDRTISFSGTIPSGVELSVKILYTPEIL